MKLHQSSWQPDLGGSKLLDLPSAGRNWFIVQNICWGRFLIVLYQLKKDTGHEEMHKTLFECRQRGGNRENGSCETHSWAYSLIVIKMFRCDMIRDINNYAQDICPSCGSCDERNATGPKDPTILHWLSSQDWMRKHIVTKVGRTMDYNNRAHPALTWRRIDARNIKGLRWDYIKFERCALERGAANHNDPHYLVE